MVTVFCDGACSGNPGPGGWAYRIEGLAGGTVDGSGHGGSSTTNNRMELSAAIAALERLAREPGPVTMRTDSRYVVDGITGWIDGWRRNGWRTASRKPVLNEDLWRRLDELARPRPDLSWEWVRGHAGNAGNEAVDRMAVDAARGVVVGAASPAPTPGVAPAPIPTADPVPGWVRRRADEFRARLAGTPGPGVPELVTAFDAIFAPPG